jgi:hypothetical protein
LASNKGRQEKSAGTAMFRACLKIEKMPDFCPKGGDFKEKTASQSRD